MMKRFVVPAVLVVLLQLVIINYMPPSIAQMSDAIREFTLHHPRPESRTKWRIPEAYLARHLDWRQTEEPTSIIAMDTVLPDMAPWWRSGLDMGRDEELKRHVSIAVESSYDFGREKRILPRLLKEDLELVGEYQGNFWRYRQVRKNERGETILVVPVSWFYFTPKEQIPGRAVYFTCVRRCTAYADFSETVVMKYGFALELLGEWQTVDQKVRNLLAKFIVPKP